MFTTPSFTAAVTALNAALAPGRTPDPLADCRCGAPIEQLPDGTWRHYRLSIWCPGSAQRMTAAPLEVRHGH